jgi:hypothetical protein
VVYRRNIDGSIGSRGVRMVGHASFRYFFRRHVALFKSVARLFLGGY